MSQKIPILIPVYNTTPETLFLTSYYLSKNTKNSIIIINDGSKRKETKKVLEYIKEKKIAEVLDKENSGKMDSLLYGLNYIIEKYNPKCVFIQDDDVIVKTKNDNLDEILNKHCNELSENYPVYVYPVKNQVYIIDNIIREINIEDNLKDLENKIREVNKNYIVNFRKEANFLDDLQDIEHIVSTELARKIVKEGLWVNGTASLWKSSELKKYLEKHSKEHYADDLELSILLRKDGKGIKFSDEIILYPELISNFKSFIKQRIKWGNGAYRVFFKYPKEFLKNPLYFSYPLFPFIFYSNILSPSEYRFGISLSYNSIMALQSLYFSKKFCQDRKFFDKFKDLNKLLGGLYITSLALVLSYILRNIYDSSEIPRTAELLGSLGSLTYTLYILKKASENNKKINMKALLKYVPYISLYSTSILPLGFLDYLKSRIAKKEKTYKIYNK